MSVCLVFILLGRMVEMGESGYREIRISERVEDDGVGGDAVVTIIYPESSSVAGDDRVTIAIADVSGASVTFGGESSDEEDSSEVVTTTYVPRPPSVRSWVTDAWDRGRDILIFTLVVVVLIALVCLIYVICIVRDARGWVRRKRRAWSLLEDSE